LEKLPLPLGFYALFSCPLQGNSSCPFFPLLGGLSSSMDASKFLFLSLFPLHVVATNAPVIA
jgi:hypothetical protein